MILLKIQGLKKYLLDKNIQLIGIYSLAFLVPFVFKQPQILIGSVINFLLVFSILQFGIKKILPVIFIPSISSLLSGMLFGTFTPYLVLMIPFIALANLIFMLAFKYIRYRYLRVVASALLKASFLFSCTYILAHIIHIPEIFFTTMGSIQLLTALIGALSFEILQTFSNKEVIA